MFAEEGVKFRAHRVRKEKPSFCALASHLRRQHLQGGACTDIFQDLVIAKPFVNILLAVFGCPKVYEICLFRPEAGADSGGIACRVWGGWTFRTQCMDVGGI